ncbi:MAG TPA: ferritin-like domain-containing protein [Chitinophagaceae bacterium]|nr:ferritin-like domain-containing protein [Chitinophagaceae bacterium]
MKDFRNNMTTASAGNGQEGPLDKFFYSQLRDMYYAEQQAQKLLLEMKEAATTEELEDALADHYELTRRHINRLEKVFSIIGRDPMPKTCVAMDGLMRECRRIVNETRKGSMTRDAALIIAMQKIEHYEIATYGGLVELALTMGKKRAAELLDKTLEEEERTDRLLTDIAERFVNIEAEEEPTVESKTPVLTA